MQSKMTVFCREPRGIKDLVSGAQLFSNKALNFLEPTCLLNWGVENNFQIGGVGVFSYVKFEFKGLSARVFYYQELWDRGLKSSNEPLNTPF